jgi:hypothetical protein
VLQFFFLLLLSAISVFEFATEATPTPWPCACAVPYSSYVLSTLDSVWSWALSLLSTEWTGRWRDEQFCCQKEGAILSRCSVDIGADLKQRYIELALSWDHAVLKWHSSVGAEVSGHRSLGLA